ncbi:MAG TPA: NmrA family NAD(P)-binding protein, partial [Bacteroidales bacterium]|nr:NmrA family NAD(P)-binding protein [Bacteroidales bacterium]
MAKRKSFFCSDLMTRPKPELGLILVTGATGYIGGRLVPELLERNYRLRVMVRSYSSDYVNRWPGAEIVQGDALDPDSLLKALQGVNTAYYLIHSLL